MPIQPKGAAVVKGMVGVFAPCQDGLDDGADVRTGWLESAGRRASGRRSDDRFK